MPGSAGFDAGSVANNGLHLGDSTRFSDRFRLKFIVSCPILAG